VAAPKSDVSEEPETERERELRDICAQMAPSLEKLLGGTIGPVRVLVRPHAYFQDANRESLATQASPQEWDGFSKLWQKLGMLPAGFDFAEEHASSASLAGFYSPDGDFVAITEQTAAAPDYQLISVLAHELVHVHRQRNGRHSTRKNLLSDLDRDWYSAVQAQLEGEAEFLAAALWRSYPQSPPVRRGRIRGGPNFAGDQDADPAVFYEVQKFIYETGAEFVVYLQKIWGLAGHSKALANPPRSTEQILHPHKYCTARPDDPTIVRGGDPSEFLGARYKKLDVSVLGEWTFRTMFLESLGDAVARSAAAGWDGDRCHLFAGPDDRLLVTIASIWDSPNDACAFADAWLKWAANRDKGGQAVRVSADTQTLRTKDGVVAVRVKGPWVFLADGFGEEGPAELLDAIAAVRFYVRTELDARRDAQAAASAGPR